VLALIYLILKRQYLKRSQTNINVLVLNIEILIVVIPNKKKIKEHVHHN
jgi:hypothetical protein